MPRCSSSLAVVNGPVHEHPSNETISLNRRAMAPEGRDVVYDKCRLTKRDGFSNLRGNFFTPSPTKHDAASASHAGASVKTRLENTLKFPLSPFGSDTLSSTASTVASTTQDDAYDNAQNTQHPSNLPVWTKWREIVDSITSNPVTMIVGETGSGKTTQIPQMLLEHFCSSESGSCHQAKRPPTIAITQPRRIAAITLASRVLSDINERYQKGKTATAMRDMFRASCPTVDSSAVDATMRSIGGLVGYSVRFQSQVSRGTRIKFLTDGVLLREALVDPLLRRYRVIIIDEAHERSLRTDILLGFLKTLLLKRKDLRVVVMSATLDYHCFTSFFGQGNVLLIPGRQHPVQIYNACSSVEDTLQSIVAVIFQIHVSKPPEGDILAFLPGQEQIEAARSMLEERNRALHSACSEFAAWLSVLGKLKDFLCHKAYLWSSFLDGGWDKEPAVSKAKESDAKNGLEHQKALLSPSLKKWNTFLSSFSDREMRIVQECRKALALHIHNTPSENGSSKLWDDVSVIRELSRLVFTASTRFVLDEDEATAFLQQSLTGQKPHSVALMHQSMLVVPLYAALPSEKQQLAFTRAPKGLRKVILATNIAETSLTLPGVKYVVDSGLYKNKAFNSSSGIEALKVERISRAMANQRTGRAGREGPGECFRLFTEQDYYAMAVQVEPEIKRSNLTQVLLELKMLGVSDVSRFPFISPPSTSALNSALDVLKKITALDASGAVTSLGKKLAALPLSPEHGKFLLDSIELDCTAEALSIVALLNTESVWIPTERSAKSLPSDALAQHENAQRINEDDEEDRTELTHLARKKILCVYGDHLTLLNAYMMWDAAGSASDRAALCKTFGLNNRNLCKARRIRKQLKDILLGPAIQLTSISSCLTATAQGTSSQETSSSGPDVIRRCLVKSFPSKIARLESTLPGADKTSYSSSSCYFIEESRIPVYIHPLSSHFKSSKKPEYIVFNELAETTKLYIRTVTAVESAWVAEFHPQLYAPSQKLTSTACSRGHLQCPVPLSRAGRKRSKTEFGSGAEKQRRISEQGSRALVQRKQATKAFSSNKTSLVVSNASSVLSSSKESVWLRQALFNNP